MIKRFHSKLNRPMIVIHPGEYYLTRADEVIATLLGSCVSVCLEDNRNHVGGMNHFLLPGGPGELQTHGIPNARYGRQAMEVLLGELLHMGCVRQDLTAKVFGGGHVLKSIPQDQGGIPRANIDLALGFLADEGIKVTQSDVGGHYGRQVLFLPVGGKVYLRRLGDETNQRLATRDQNYHSRLDRGPLEDDPGSAPQRPARH